MQDAQLAEKKVYPEKWKWDEKESEKKQEDSWQNVSVQTHLNGSL